jgi:hypothetical protein
MAMFQNSKQNGHSLRNILLKNNKHNGNHNRSSNSNSYIQKPEITRGHNNEIISVYYPQIEIRTAGAKGLGVFVRNKVLRRGSLIVYGGVIIDKKDFDNCNKSPIARKHHCYITSYEENKGEIVSWVDAHERRAKTKEVRQLWAGSFVNHPNSDEVANAVIDMDFNPFPYDDYPGVDNTVVIRLTKDVPPGGEILADYGYSDIVLHRMGIKIKEPEERSASVPAHVSKVRRDNMKKVHKIRKQSKHTDRRRKENK